MNTTRKQTIRFSEDRLKQIVKESVKKVMDEKHLYSNVRFLNTSGAYNGNRYISFTVNENKKIYSSLINEGIHYEPDKKHKGGIITFSTDVNCEKLSNNIIVNKIKQFVTTWKNRLTASNKVDNIAEKYQLEGWTIGHFLNGRYTDYETKKRYSENSLSLELIGVDTETLFKIGEDLCRDFNQQSVLVKDYNTNKIAFIDNK